MLENESTTSCVQKYKLIFDDHSSVDINFDELAEDQEEEESL